MINIFYNHFIAILTFFFVLISVSTLLFSDKIIAFASSPQITFIPATAYKETIVVAMDYEYEPYSFIKDDGSYSGYDVELIYAISEKIQKNVVIKMMTWENARQAVINGEADIVMGLGHNPELLPEIEFSIPLHNDKFVAFGKENFSSVSHLYGKKLATIADNESYNKFFTPYKLDKNISYYKTYNEVFASVVRGENDYAIIRYAVGRRIMAKTADSTIGVAGPTLADNHLSIGAKKGNTALIAQINDAVIELVKDGTMDILSEKWLGQYVRIITIGEFISANRTMLGGILFTLFLVGILVYFDTNRKTRRAERVHREGVSRLLAYQRLFMDSTKGLYENIYEFNITNNAPGTDTLNTYFDGMPEGTTYEDALRIKAHTTLKKEFIDSYLSNFSRENILALFNEGKTVVKYDCMITNDGENYYWIRIMGKIFFWEYDSSIRMITYRQNIDNEKNKEILLFEKMKKDPLTGLYNKVSTEDVIKGILADTSPNSDYAFFILDIDNFKNVNDTMGHSIGDNVIVEFANKIKSTFRNTDIVGRIGGDEFVVFINYPSKAWLKKKSFELSRLLSWTVQHEEQSCQVSASIGISLCPDDGTDFQQLYKKADKALYLTKARGKNSVTMYGEK